MLRVLQRLPVFLANMYSLLLSTNAISPRTQLMKINMQTSFCCDDAIWQLSGVRNLAQHRLPTVNNSSELRWKINTHCL